MATTKKTLTAEDRLRALYDLQLIDSRIDRIRVIRGELPLEVEDLENDIAGISTRLAKMEEENDTVTQRISAYQIQIKDSQALIDKYTEQQNNVRNNREFESLNKEMEYQTLEIELCEKRIRECKAQQSQKSEILEAMRIKSKQRQADLDSKQSELQEIIAETQAEEEVLQKQSDKMSKTIDDRLLLKLLEFFVHERIHPFTLFFSKRFIYEDTSTVLVHNNLLTKCNINLALWWNLDEGSSTRLTLNRHDSKTILCS